MLYASDAYKNPMLRFIFSWHTTATNFLIAVMVLASLVIATIAALQFNRPIRATLPKAASHRQYVFSPETYVVHGKGHLGETHVPFRLNYGREIVVKALINGKPTKCIVDTGSSDILWPSCLHLTEQRTGLQSSISDAGGHKTSIQEALLERVQIGGLELQHIPSYAVIADHAKAGTLPILGNSAFAHTILTIDYAKQELIIRPSVMNSILLRVLNRGHVMDFQWIDPNARGQFGVPCVRGTVMSLPAGIIIDTGWVENPLGLTRRFYGQLLPQLKAKHIRIDKGNGKFLLGTANVIAISHVSCSLPGIIVRSPAIAVDALNPGAQASLGWSFLRHFKTTIDYPQQKIWFDPIQTSD